MRNTIRQPAAPAHLTLKAIRLTQKMRNGAIPASALDDDEVAIVIAEIIRNVDQYRGIPTREGVYWWLQFVSLCTLENPAALVVREWLLLGNGYLGQALRSQPEPKRREAFRALGCEYRGAAE